MAVIKNLAFCNKNKLKNLKSFRESKLDLSVFYPFPIDFVHSFLPFKLKFLEESFVAFENKKIGGLVTVAKTGAKKAKITRLLLDENSTELGKLLVNCVVTLFLSKGVESFFVIIDKRNFSLLNMFKAGMGFNKFAVETIYKVNAENLPESESMGFEHIRKTKISDAKKIVGLINNSMNSYQRAVFSKEFDGFKEGFFTPMEQFVISDDKKNNFLGCFNILKLNDSDYLLDFVLLKGYEGYFADIIKFAKIKLLKRKNFKTLLIRTKSYYSNYNELNDILNIEYKNHYESEILVKNFFIPKKQFLYERTVFNDITPAF